MKPAPNSTLVQLTVTLSPLNNVKIKVNKMKKLIVWILMLVFLSIEFSCSDCDEDKKIINQIGDWEGIKITQKLSESFDTLSIDTIDVFITINDDLTGNYNNKEIINWGKEYNSSIDKEEIRLDFAGGTLMTAFISTDEINYQEWEIHETYAVTFERRAVYHKLNRK